MEEIRLVSDTQFIHVIEVLPRLAFHHYLPFNWRRKLLRVLQSAQVNRSTVLANAFVLAFAVCSPLFRCAAQPQKPVTSKSAKAGEATGAKDNKSAKPEKTIYDFNLPGPNGKDVPVATFKGKYVLLVNLARNSTYNAQLPALNKLYETYKERGLVVVGVPSNDFGAEEPGTEAEIQKDYLDAKVTFPVMAVSKLKGDDEIPLYVFLTKGKGVLPGGPVAWNFTKFILGKDGKPITRLSPDVAPDSQEMLATVEQILGGRFKPAKKDGKPGDGDTGDDDE